MSHSVSSSLPNPNGRRPATLFSLPAIRAGDPDALAACSRAHAPTLMALALRLTASRQDAEDIVHDVFVGLPEALARYDERGQFGAWIGRVTTRVALMRQRQVRQRGDVSLAGIAEPAVSTPDGDPLLQEKVLQSLAMLTPPLRHVFVLRVMLPSGDAAAVPVPPTATASAFDQLSVEQLASRVWMIVIAVAATVVAAVTSLWLHQTATGALPTTARAVPRLAAPAGLAVADSTAIASSSNYESLMDGLSPRPRVAFAQSPGASNRNAPYPGLRTLDESRLKPGRRSYLRSVGNALHELLPFTTYTVELDSAVLEKQRTWCLVTVTQTSTGLAENSERNAQHDSLWLRRNDLRPIRLSRHAGFLHMRQTFTDSTLLEADSLIAPAGKTLRNGMKLMPFRNGTFRQLDARRPFVPTEETMRLLLRAAPLHERWRASVGALSGDNRTFAMGDPEYLNLRVDGSHDVQTLSGRFATWRVVLETGPKPEVWYVSKESGETLLTEGSWGVAYPVSETRLLYGFEETKQLPPVGTR